MKCAICRNDHTENGFTSVILEQNTSKMLEEAHNARCFQFKKRAGILVTMVLVLLFFAPQGFCRSAGQTADGQPPGPDKGVTEQSEAVFTRGGGPYEVMIFTDYFCPPCRKLEHYLEEKLPELASSGVRVTFLDAPFHQRSSLYARYFLYAARAASSLKSVVHARSVLFQLAENGGIESESALNQAMKENNVDIQLFNIRPVINQWVEIMNKHNLRVTPACVIIRPGREPEQYQGGKKISKALNSLSKEISSDPPNSRKSKAAEK